MTGYVKRDHVAQNAKFYRFSNCQLSEPQAAVGFILGSWAVRPFCLLNPTLKGWASLCCEMAALQTDGKNGRFRTASTRSRATPTPEMGVAPNFPRVSRDDWRILWPSLKPIAIILFDICAIKVKNFVFARHGPFSHILSHLLKI